MRAIQNMGLYIDMENIMYRKKFEVSTIIQYLEKKGKIMLSKAYADWGRFAKQKKQMTKNSIEMIDLPTKGYGRKNSADIKLVVDAMEAAIMQKELDTFVIVSGDSDFVPLILKLRTLNKKVIVIGDDQKNTSHLLLEHCDKLVFYRDLNPAIFREEGNVLNAFSLILKTVEKLSKRNITVTGSLLKQFIKHDKPFFNEIKYGFPQFKKLLIYCQEVGIIHLENLPRGGDFVIKALIAADELEEKLQPSSAPSLDVNKIDLSQILPFNQSNMMKAKGR